MLKVLVRAVRATDYVVLVPVAGLVAWLVCRWILGA